MGRFDLVQPSLIQQLKTILDQYQDDGQILKELIQNAEDARATEVKFLLDETQHDTRSKNLQHADMAEFQGGALYAFNNAEFTENDWVGLKMINDSVKKNDAMKVGRFGLGFKSVFHMTDLPSVISGEKLSFIDPHERFFSEEGRKVTGFTWNLKDDYKTMKKLTGQFDPYRGLFGCSDVTFKQGHYSGTMFRFPLRNKQSLLSNNLYNTDKVLQIFESFQSIAELVLLFLTSVESIELYRRKQGQTQPELLFKVQISSDTLHSVRLRRSDLLAKIGQGRSYTDVKSVFPVSIDSIRYDKHQPSKSSARYLVSHYCAGTNKMSEDMTSLLSDPSMTYIPWVSAAVVFDGSKVSAHTPTGHVFCFLPLPLQRSSMSGLPVHINGFFAVSSNRHQLKWPSIKYTDGRSGEKVGVTDKACLWNELLLEEVVPKAMFYLVSAAIDMNRQSQQGSLDNNYIYNLLPDPDVVLDRWKLVLPLFYKMLSQIEFILSDSSKSWQTYQKVILLSQGDESQVHQVLLKSLVRSGVNAAALPSHMITILKTHISAADMFTTPELMRLLMRKKPNVLKSLSDEEKIVLLGYLLSDDDYVEMDELPLLPLSNGEFTIFCCNKSSPHLYISSDSHPASVLPMIADRFIDVSNRIDDDVIRHLKAMAMKECSQLRIFTARIFSTLLPDLITDKTLLCDAYYGDIVWEYVTKNFSSAKKFEGLYLIPSIDKSGRQTVLTLSREKPILTCCQGVDCIAQISSLLMDTLHKLGVRLVHQVPAYILSNKLLLHKYIYLPTAKGIKNVLKAYCDAELLNDLSTLNHNERISLKTILSKLNPIDLTEDDVTFLKALPLFQCMTSSHNYLSVTDTAIAAPFDCPPLPATCLALDVRDAASKSLSELLGVTQITKAMLLLDYIIPAIDQGLCNSEETCSIILSVLQHFKSYLKEDMYIKTRLQAVKCVRREDEQMVTADLCYDPSDALLSHLLLGEQLFPHPDFCQPLVLEALKALGLKSGKDVDRDLLISTAKNIEDMSVNPTADRKLVSQKSLSLLNYLDMYTELVEKDMALKLALEGCCWVVPQTTPTANLPHSMNWFSSGGCTVAPDSITDASYATLISSAMAILPVEVNERLKDVFKWNQRPLLTYIADQLSNLISSYRASEKGAYMHILAAIYKALSTFTFSQVKQAFDDIQLVSWVWHGDGFIPPNRVVIEKMATSLSPYVYSQPPEMNDFTKLLTQAGAWLTCTPDVLLEVLELIKDKYQQIELFDKEEVSADLRLVLDIINQLRPSPGEELSPYIQQRLLVPVLTENERLLTLAPVTECTYCDTDWLRERRSQMDHTETVNFIHPSISNEVAEQLGVLSLVNRMLDTDTFELGEGFGQSEPLTRRLHNLLKEYSDGFAVPKELLQNADDAGATEVRFMYDERTNKDSLNCLIDDGLKDCQGPALWVYNNAVFSDADFEAIIKLSGATKSRQTEKIGGFGLGFNAVYNLTDVPSFVSRNFVVIFDPHTTHLGKSIPDANKPGIKIDLQKNHKALGTLKNQFKPYNGIFGADLRHRGHGVTYDGTLFRFPLRSEEQARKSEISGLHYNREQMVELLEMMARSCDSLLLFTQNVRKVSVYHLKENQQPNQASLLFSVSKEPVKYLRELRVPINLPSSVIHLTEDEQEFTRQSSILKAASSILQDQRERRNSRLGSSSRATRRSSSSSKSHLPESSILMKMKYRQSREGCQFLRLLDGPQDRSVHWLVTSSMGDGDAMEAALRHEGLAPVGGVAVPLDKKDMKGEVLQPHIMRDPQCDTYAGMVFCYLPLPIKSGLPVHINGAFAVTSNRRHLVEKVTDNKTNQLVEWNHALMGDSITKSYLLMLEDIKPFVDPSVYSFYLLWPRVSSVTSSCLPLVHQFYMAVSSPLTEQKLFSSANHWVTLANTVLLDSEVRSSPIAEEAFTLLKLVIASSNNLVLDIPEEILTCFDKANCLEPITERTLTREMLFQKIVFPNLTKIPEEIRDLMVLHALDSGGKLLAGLIRSHACVPVTPTGVKLSFVQDLINPAGQLAVLYSKDDGRFPHGTKSTFLSAQRLAALESLGMISVDLPDTELLERAQSIPHLYATNQKAALSRTCALLQYMDSKLVTSPDLYNDIQSRLRKVPFLPVRKRPADSTLAWAGEKHDSDLLAPELLYPSRVSGVMCYVQPVLDSSLLGITLSHRLSNYLGIDKPVTADDVIRQLKVIQSHRDAAMACYKLTQAVCHDIYQYIQENKMSANVMASLGEFILIGDNLVSPQHVVLKGGRDCAPYLFELPYDLQKFEHVFKQAGMREKFEISDYVKAIALMYDNFDSQELNNRDLHTLLNMATLLHHTMHKQQLPIADVVRQHGPVYLVNAANRLVNAASLCFNDCNWLPDEQNMEFAHNLIPYQIAKSLGVNTKRQEAIKKHSQGIPFGQKEKLTKRLKRIMSSYPCGKEIFKELLQNADDAGATEIHFVRDCRQHPTEKVFEDCWKPLQGPALCVYNNRPFSKSDLQGIQNLGEGSKGQDPNRTGQYGVGFNSVYHLTDSPSFLTSGPEVGEVLCAFDPHCKFVPGATPDEPGRMFNDLCSMKKVFTDVFNCYLPDHFSLDGATMFRFPLRTHEMSMHSKISNSAVTLDTVAELMKKFRQEMFDVLLFVNNLEEITVSDIPRNKGGPSESYTVKAKVTQRYAKLRKEFTAYIKEVLAKLDNKEISLRDVAVKEIAYKMSIEDSLGFKETWLVVQRIGFEHPSLVPQSVCMAHSSGELNLLPRGGVACLLNREVPKNMKLNDRPKKVFCFLPLPIHTKLPVHINGHFALDHEARRGLWRDDDGGPRTDWNNTLIAQVICPAYKRLLESCKEKSFPSIDGFTSHIRPELVDVLLCTYHSMFPEQQQDEQWQSLVDGLYRTIAASDSRLFPVLNRLCKRKRVLSVSNGHCQEPWEAEHSSSSSSLDSESTDSRESEQPITTLAEVSWYPLLGQSDNVAYFMNESDRESLPGDVCNALISGGFNLLSSPFSIFKAFETAKVQAYMMTADTVVEFLKCNRLIMPDLPAELNTTPFHCIETLKGIINYCLKMDDLLYNLDDLPFGLDQDNHLHYLSSEDQLFYSSRHELVPECADLFLHSDLVKSVFSHISTEHLSETVVFKMFGVEEFGLYINQTLCDEFCPSTSLMVAWDPDGKERPNRTWLCKIWTFLSEQTQSIISEHGEDPVGAMDSLEMVLFALQSWCLLPVYAVPDSDKSSEPDIIVGKEGSALREISKKLSMSRSMTSLTSSGLEEREHCLVPLQHSHMVMDFSQKDGMTDAMRQALRKLKLPELNHKLVDGKTLHGGKQVSPSGPAGSQLTRLLCAKVTDPRSVLRCLNYCIDRSKQSIGQLLHSTECNLILKYFSEAIDNKQLSLSDSECVDQLRRLPFYISLSGQQTDLAEYQVYILPQGIPGAEIDVWRSKAGVLFLQRNDSLVSLYSLLDCQSLTDIQVYCQFIFEHFEYLSDGARVIHLTYIRDRCRDRKLPMLTDEEKETLIDRLTTLKFIKSQSDGELHTASHYFDAENRLFQLMLSRDKFPPEPYDNYRWIRFLRLIGLNSEVSDEKFVEFALRIAQESLDNPDVHRLGTMSRTVAELDEKAKVLIHELYKTNNLASNVELLTELRTIPFLCATRVNSKYHDFCAQYGFSDREVRFICFNDSLPDSKENTRCSWTSACFLPHWADPSQLKSTDICYDYHEADELSSLECYKEEIARQLGVKCSPSKEQMVRHIINISQCVEKEDGRKLSAEKSELMVEVMTCLYQYLMQYSMDDEYTMDQLQDVSCVIIEGGKTLVKANQLVLNLYEEQQIRPYLYKTPTELSNYNSLFRYLGATERATADQFAAVLDQLYSENEDEVLHPNSLRCAYRAVQGLFTLLSRAESPDADLQSLYLPSQDACLRPAASLVYNDEPSYSDRLLNFDLPFLVDLRECKLQISYFNEIVRKLPEELRPLMLTDLVEECLDDSCVECHSSYGAAQVLRSRLTSTEFTAGILRLIRHDHMERAEKPKSAALKAVQRSLKSIRVHAVEELLTYLKYDGEKIVGSESDAECFITKTVDSKKVEWSLYVHTEAEVTPQLLVKVAEIVNKIAGGLLQNSIIYLHPILSCPAYEIPLTLDKLRIRQDHHSAKAPTLQPPGTFIPLDLHHLLKQDFVDFEPEEYVGFELDDPEMYNQRGSATYIYATVLEKLPVECAKYDKNTQRFFDRYRINIGEDALPVIVSSLDLYRLHRVIEKKKPANLSLHGDVYNDTSFTQTESGDYLLMSPGGQSLAAELDEGVIVQEEEDEDEQTEDAAAEREENLSADTEAAAEASDAAEEEEKEEEIWEETTVYSEVHVDTEKTDEPDALNYEPQRPAPAQTKSGAQAAPSDIPQLDFPEICEGNVGEIEKMLNKQVRAIWKLPEEQRKKIIKRLMLKFHPDKNPGKIELCTRLTQHIRVVIEDIEGGGFVADKENRSDWWSEFINRRAKAYGEQKNDFEEKLQNTYAQYASTLGPEFAAGPKGYNSANSREQFEKFKNATRRNPVPEEARRWLRQARADLKSAYNDFEVEEPAYEWVLLKAHQAAEKALKAGCYTLDSKKVNLTDLKLISGSLHDKQVSEYAKRLQELIGLYDQLTHPSNSNFPKIPHELVEKERAAQVLDLCETLLNKISTEFLEAMERDLRGESSTPEQGADNSLALVLVPKDQVRNWRTTSKGSDQIVSLTSKDSDTVANGDKIPTLPQDSNVIDSKARSAVRTNNNTASDDVAPTTDVSTNDTASKTTKTRLKVISKPVTKVTVTNPSTDGSK